MKFAKADYVVTFFRNDPDGTECVVSRHGVSAMMLEAYATSPAVALAAARRAQSGLKAVGFRVASPEGNVVLHFRLPCVP